jgi:hypothetical protein
VLTPVLSVLAVKAKGITTAVGVIELLVAVAEPPMFVPVT